MDDSNEPQGLDGIAVVGLAGRFPGARDCDEFWQNLREGRETLSFFSDQELIDAGYIREADRGKRTRARGVVEDACLFDAAFFGYTPREAEVMDPQQRVFLELAWEALENAGLDPDRAPGAVGVFAGASINSYYPNNIVSRPDILGPFGVFPAVALNEKDFLATRIAYKLNLRGPAISVQTACSTSLVAVCNACQSLLSFECDVALAGGIAINFPQSHSFIHEEGGMISADGHCRPFDKDASGTLFSDGAGVVALRRLEDAVEAGDTILAVIKGFALNNDGSDKAGFTAPSVSGQADVVAMAQAFADVDPETITYVEAHGTATPLGDPIEIAGLTQAFGSVR
ncbi:MAG: polyketide synthase, partial [Woeseiaceae bacterium]